MPESKSPLCVADVKAVLGEGAVWAARENALDWVDIERSLARQPWGGGLLSVTPGVSGLPDGSYAG